jgi:hypothetical protein
MSLPGIAVKSESASAQLFLKLVASEGDRLAVIIRARDLERRWCSHSLWTSLKGSELKPEALLAMMCKEG